MGYIINKQISNLVKCHTLLENKKREDIKCVKRERVNVFPNARLQNAWQNARCAHCICTNEWDRNKNNTSHYNIILYKN